MKGIKKQEEVMTRTSAKILRSSIITMMAVLALLLAVPFAQADTDELEHIRQAIKAKGARWHADETSVSGLSEKEKKMRLGVLEQEEAVSSDSGYTNPVPLVTAVPPTLDWRNVNGVSYVTPVKNQGSCGSCWAFAVTGALESQVMIGTGGLPIDLSEQILVSCSGAGSCSGGSPATASNYIRDVGLPLESCFGYTATNNSCINACLNWQNDIYRVIGWHRASSSTITVDNLKNAVYAYGPVVATMYVYNDFFSYRSGVYSYATGSYVGAHAVLVVGYDDIGQAFIVKNSWGTGWGEAGYFMIAYSEVTGASRFGYSALAYDGYGDKPTPPPPACAYSISPTSKTFKAAGGSAAVSVSSQSGCSWTATSGPSWVSITSGASGDGNGTVSYTVQPNPDPTARSATLNIAGMAYKVSQQGARIPKNPRK
jgi:C1A family cysteine protease